MAAISCQALWKGKAVSFVILTAVVASIECVVVQGYKLNDLTEAQLKWSKLTEKQILQRKLDVRGDVDHRHVHLMSYGHGESHRHNDQTAIDDGRKKVKSSIKANTETERRKVFMYQKELANKNLRAQIVKKLRDGEIVTYNPGDKAEPFSIFTLEGPLTYPSPPLENASILFHVFDPETGFLDCLWNSEEALVTPLMRLPNNTHVVFLSAVPVSQGLKTAVWMKAQLTHGLDRLGFGGDKDLLGRLHFGVTPVKALGNWIPSVLKQWMCVDHNCGYAQVVVQAPDITSVLVLPRLDARYDWLPSPGVVFPNRTVQAVVDAGDGCLPTPDVKNQVALVSDSSCSYFTKVAAMEKSGALAVIVQGKYPAPIRDMNCEGDECSQPLSIPATMVTSEPTLFGVKDKVMYYQNTPSDNFHLAIDSSGRLAEAGWWLYPSMEFLVWEAQWLNYRSMLTKRLELSPLVVPVFKSKVMQGQAGVVANVTLPPMAKLQGYGRMELDMSLSCPGSRDTTCAHWDHTIQLFVCCPGGPPMNCEMEIGRWISPFRRRVGRWLTDITPLLPLLAGDSCTFTMKTAPWALPWVPSLNLRFSRPQSAGSYLYPDYVAPLYNPGATFDKSYNSHFPPVIFRVPPEVKKVELYSVITGHGSDENGCGEFCVTSHHFVVNNFTANITFSDAGSPEGCADRVPSGVIPNEHGTWLYGRDGWCDGQQVDAWRVDITSHVTSNNTLRYYGWFNGTDPNPQKNPGIMILWSYLVYYKPL